MNKTCLCNHQDPYSIQGSSPQENVVISGGSVDQTIEFAVNSVAQSSVQVSVSITDDDIALENVEQYPLSLHNRSITNNVVLGGDTEISITDDDCKQNDFH